MKKLYSKMTNLNVSIAKTRLSDFVQPKLNAGFWICALLVLTLINQPVSADSPKKIVKWKDEKGVVHYGDKLPAEAAGRGNSEINKSGMVVKQNEAYNPKLNSDVAAQEAADNAKKDAALLASYNSIEEIDLARDRNIKSDELALSALNQRITDTKALMKIEQEKIDKRKKNKGNVPVNWTENVNRYQLQIIKIQGEVTTVEQNIANTKARFAAQKNRYAELKPRDQSLTDIRASKKSLAELESWRSQAQTRLDYLLAEALRAKRAGEAQPASLTQQIQQANEEVARANLEIDALNKNIKKSQQTFSK